MDSRNIHELSSIERNTCCRIDDRTLTNPTFTKTYAYCTVCVDFKFFLHCGVSIYLDIQSTILKHLFL